MKAVRKAFRVSAFNKPLRKDSTGLQNRAVEFIFRLIRNTFVIPRYDE